MIKVIEIILDFLWKLINKSERWKLYLIIASLFIIFSGIIIFLVYKIDNVGNRVEIVVQKQDKINTRLNMFIYSNDTLNYNNRLNIKSLNSRCNMLDNNYNRINERLDELKVNVEIIKNDIMWLKRFVISRSYEGNSYIKKQDSLGFIGYH